MFRLVPALRAGAAAAILWLGSGVAFALIVWFGLYRGDIVRLLVPETVPVETWQLAAPWPAVIPLASSLAVGGATAWGVSLLDAAAGIPRRARLLATWMVVVLAAAATGAATGIGTVIGNGPPPRLAFLAQGVPDAVALGLAAGLLWGWIPAWIALPRRVSQRDQQGLPGPVAGTIAAAAGLALIAATAVVVAEARQAGLEGTAPPSVQQPQPDPVPTGTPPPQIAPGDHPVDPTWCTAAQVLLEVPGADGATGHRAATLLLTNVGADACTLSGYPDIAFADENGVAVDAAVRLGGGFMTEDPGATTFVLEPSAGAVAALAWDATDGRSTVPQLLAAPYPGALRSVIFLEPPFDITTATEVAVTAWARATDVGSAP